MDPRWQAPLQLVIGAIMLLVAVLGAVLVPILYPSADKSVEAFGTLIAVGSGLISNVMKGPNQVTMSEVERMARPRSDPPPPLRA